MLSQAKIGHQSGPTNTAEIRTARPEPLGAILRGALDKLAQLSQDCPNGLKTAPNGSAHQGGDDVKKLLKRARSKFITNGITNRLRNIESPLHKSYINTYFCAQTLQQSGKTLTGRYCGNRWCLVCNRIRVARLIKDYKSPLMELPDKYFVTLTRPNVKGAQLREEIKTLTATIRTIVNLDLRRKEKIKVVGVRKLECTYNTKRNDFHPHFHFIVSGRNQAFKLVEYWLKRNPTASPDAQDIRKADDNSVLELFKYFTKVLQDGRIYPEPLDVIFQSMRRLRVYQSMGIPKVSEEVESIVSEDYQDLMDKEILWQWREDHQSGDWYSMETGECLTGYKPNEWAVSMRTGKNL